MSKQNTSGVAREPEWLIRYYGVRACFSVAWVVTAFAIGKTASPLADLMLTLYPAWDAIANYRDATRNGGLKVNPTQALNAAISLFVTLAVAVVMALDTSKTLYVFGAWAFLAGILQLATGVRRWRSFGAQWPMVLSGAQSAIAGFLFIKRASGGLIASPKDVAPYAAFGALYFAIAAGALAFASLRRRRAVAG